MTDQRGERVVLTGVPPGNAHRLAGGLADGSTVDLNQCFCGEPAEWDRRPTVAPWDDLVIICTGSGWEIAFGRIERTNTVTDRIRQRCTTFECAASRLLYDYSDGTIGVAEDDSERIPCPGSTGMHSWPP